MMKTGTSTLNPYAASYIPLSRRVAVGETEDFETEGSKTHNDPAWGYQPDMYNIPCSVIGLQTTDNVKPKSHPGYVYYVSSSHHAGELTEKQIADEEFDMEMEYLQMTFPGISNESLTDVYLANKGDLEATVDMLNQLEQQYSDSSEKLPDTLDIGDVSEPGSSAELASQRSKNVRDEVGTSSYRPSELPLGFN